MRKELVAASVEPVILGLLAKGENYGYAIIQEVRRLSGGRMEWTDGMLYPVLHRLQRSRRIRSRWHEAENGRMRKYYSLTQTGRKALAREQADWNSVQAVLTSVTTSTSA